MSVRLADGDGRPLWEIAAEDARLFPRRPVTAADRRELAGAFRLVRRVARGVAGRRAGVRSAASAA